MSGGARIRAEQLLAPSPVHDSKLFSKSGGLGKVSLVYLESRGFCFTLKALEAHDD